jgi:hypothetical protein
MQASAAPLVRGLVRSGDRAGLGDFSYPLITSDAPLPRRLALGDRAGLGDFSYPLITSDAPLPRRLR